MLYAFFVLFSQIVETQAVFFRIHNRQKFCLQHSVLGFIQQALKYGILHSLPIIDALFRNFPQLFWPAASSVFTS